MHSKLVLIAVLGIGFWLLLDKKKEEEKEEEETKPGPTPEQKETKKEIDTYIESPNLQNAVQDLAQSTYFVFIYNAKT